MRLSAIDKTGRASRLAGEAGFALGIGDTATAAAKHLEAGRVLERESKAARRAADRHLLGFLAATQYYHGGHYDRALKVCRRVEERHLPLTSRDRFAPFRRDVEERAAPGYKPAVRDRLAALWGEKKWAAALELLKNHHHVLNPADLAFVRAGLCEQLGDYAAAALFHADAVRHRPDRAVAAAIYPCHLAMHGRVGEAWEYVQKLVQPRPDSAGLLAAFAAWAAGAADQSPDAHPPHPAVLATASLVCWFRADEAAGSDERDALCRQQLRYFGDAWRSYTHLPEGERQRPALRDHIGKVAVSAVDTMWQLGDWDRAVEVADRAVSLAPDEPAMWVMRGLLTYPGVRSLEDFREAIRRGERDHRPYYFLAHDALGRRAFAEADGRIASALRWDPPQPSRGRLLAWRAACRLMLGGSPEEVDRLFREAVEMVPDDTEVRTLYRAFLDDPDSPAFVFTAPAPEPNFTVSRELIDRLREQSTRDLFSLLASAGAG